MFSEVHSIMMFPLLIGRTASKLVNQFKLLVLILRMHAREGYSSHLVCLFVYHALILEIDEN